MKQDALRREVGAALVLVLVGLLVIALLAMSLGLTATLDGLTARNAQDAALAAAQAEGALQLAAASLVGDAAVGGTAVLGPWPGLGISGTVRVTPLSDAAWRIESSAAVRRSLAVRSVVLRIVADGTVRVAARK